MSSDKMEKIEHKDSCYFNHSTPMDGDEAARCSCGAMEEAYMKWLEQQQVKEVKEDG